MSSYSRALLERSVLGLALLGVAVYVVLGATGAAPEAVTAAIYCLASALAALLCVLRAMRGEADRRAWLTVAAGWVLYSTGHTAYALTHVYTEGHVPTPSIADAFWLAMLPPMYVGIILLLRRHVMGLAATAWVDAAIAALGTATLVAAFVHRPASTSNGDSVGETAVLVAYVAADFALLTLVLGLLCILGLRSTRSLTWLAGGLMLFTALDCFYLSRVRDGGFEPGGWFDGLYIVAMLAIALAARPSDRLQRARRAGTWLVGMSVVFAAASLAVLVQAPRTSELPLAAGLAATTIAVALLRVGLLYWDLRTVAGSASFTRTDDLTGLPNRRAFSEILHVDIQRAARRGDERFALLLVDLDERFKEVNDALGHATGDELLRAVGERMVDELRRTDTLARWGGDEFAVLLPEADQEQAERIADRLGTALREPFKLGGMTLHLGCSIGIALYPDHASESGELLRQADVAVIAARSTRRNWRLYQADTDSHTRERLEMLDELRSALEDGGLVLHYQPKASLVSGSIVGVEALARWQHPTKGLLFPDVLIPLVEEAGLMGELTLCVLRQALAQCAEWRRNGLELSVAVNLSPVSVVDETLPDMLADLLRQYDLPAQLLEVEITEDSLLGDRERASSVLSRVRELGILVSVDDYGTGYSSLAYLRDLPVDQLKLDRSFIFPMSGDPTAAAIVRSTIGLAHSLGLQMVAEGVEDATAWEELNRYGCDQAQGYYLSRPVTPAVLWDWLESRAAAADEAAAELVKPQRVLELPLQAGGEG